ncbi:NAD-dependent epimerase/dehydratase family protein [Nitrospirillum amazonense]|uniref:Nucleoside-diphosphate-sugar epimerase n=1 Tax=Nitrospirillum amazonense TaxID=28077 RepID=A0A560KGB5_9PROT|nr:NAD-dependent epimerase/dehydratase family protein [Nitrospirillum amazonense]MDG3443527.1 NAD-dependent epimerase/dehydratase family protein [Nitrospirillum amazonense]TWB82333.1 nucleoside-diphosphate-sugar epimerase [Nitrospirillum amazonense]
MRIILTGAGGFVGRHLARRLLARGPNGGRVERLVLADLEPPAFDDIRVRRVVGDLSDAAVRARLVADGADMLFHLAALPGGAATRDPALSRKVNLDGTLDLIEAMAAAHGGRTLPPRVVYTSTIAVLGHPMPALVDDATPLRPAMTYGAHKLMVEVALADYRRRGLVDPVAIRLSGILARPGGATGLKSAFMSDVFHALAAGRPYICPVSPAATIWAMSLDRCVDNLLHAARVDCALMPAGGAVTLPALCVSMGELIAAIARRLGADAGLVTHVPDGTLEAAFGAHPPLLTPAAEAAGFHHDGTLDALVESALATL